MGKNIRVNIYKVYYQLVVSKTQMKQLDANVERAGKLLHDTKALFQNGFQEQLDVDRAAVQLANLETQRERTINTIANGYLALKYLIGMPIKDSLALTDDITEDQIKKDLLTDTLANVYASRNDYQLLQIERDLNNYNVKRYKYAFYPTLNLNAAYQKQAYSDHANVFAREIDWFTTSYAGLSLNVPIFSGFAKKANVAKAQLDVNRTQNQLDNLKLSIDNDVSQARNNFKYAVSTLDYQKKNMNLAEEVYNQTKKKYESGLGNNTDVTNAQTDFITAQTIYISAMYDAVIAKIDYLKAIGQLP
jgi:outer membrane protein TolC